MANKNFKKRILTVLNCSTSTNDSEHLCEEPLMLSCGHYICHSCLPISLNHSNIKCNTCGKTNKKDLSQNEEPQAFDALFDQNINELFDITLENYKSTFITCKEMIYNYEKRIDTHTQFIRDSILVRFESIKLELDKLYDKFMEELDDINKNWKSEMKSIKFEKFDLKKYEVDLKDIEKFIKEENDPTKEYIYKYQNQLKKIQLIMQEYKDTCPSLEFKDNEQKPTQDLIGELVFDIGDVDKMIMKRLRTNKYEQMNVQYQPWDLCELPNGNLLLSNYGNSNLQLYDANMKPLKAITHISGNTYQIIGVTSDENNNIYMCTYNKNQVIKTDSNFNQLAIYGSGSAGAGPNQLYYPTGICYYNNSVYVCDFQNSRIQKLNSNLAFQASYQLGYLPWYIKNIENVAVVRANSLSAIYFYDLSTFNMLKSFDGHNGLIGASKKRFYEFFPNDNTMYCYKENGELAEQIQTNCAGLTTSNGYGSICIMKKKIILTNYGVNNNLITII